MEKSIAVAAEEKEEAAKSSSKAEVEVDEKDFFGSEELVQVRCVAIQMQRRLIGVSHHRCSITCVTRSAAPCLACNPFTSHCMHTCTHALLNHRS